MWRAFFLAVGITLLILGGECLVIERAVLNREVAKAAVKSHIEKTASAIPAKRDITPPEWAPWSLLSAGAVVMLYSFTIPQRVAAG